MLKDKQINSNLKVIPKKQDVSAIAKKQKNKVVVTVRKIMKDITNQPTINAGIKVASKESNNSFNSMKGKYYRYKQNGGKLHGRQMLTDAQETTLCAVIEAFGAAHRPDHLYASMYLN
jgi:hypothetical protein